MDGAYNFISFLSQVTTADAFHALESRRFRSSNALFDVLLVNLYLVFWSA